MKTNPWLLYFASAFIALSVIAVSWLFPARVSADVAGCPLFPPDNVWNTRVDSLPVDARSNTFINAIGANTTLHPDFGTVWNGGPIGIPYTTVLGTQPLVPISFYYPDESDPGPYPIPPNVPIEYGSDHHILIVEQTHCRLYEVYDASTSNNGVSWNAGSGAVWNLNSHALRPDTWTSADAAGLPILPGLVRYEEVATGVISHALRFTIHGTDGTHIWPARHRTPSAGGNSPNLPPMGQRFRLKASFNTTTSSPPVQVILHALKTYGMFVADNGSDWYISGVPDPRWNDDMLVSELRRVHGYDFEAVNETVLMLNPNSGQVRGALAMRLHLPLVMK